MKQHYSVLLNESINALKIIPSGIYVDCTLGLAGHSQAILKKLSSGKLYCFDQDETAIEYSKKILADEILINKCEIIKANFANLTAELARRQVNKVNGIIYDLGVSSPQLDEKERGFSYRYNSKLDMRMDINQSLSAFDIVNSYSQIQLNKIFSIYGEEKYSKEIAKKICIEREKKIINTTGELVEIIKSSLPSSVLRLPKHPAKKVFQALRIAVNEELTVLQISLQQASELLDVGGRLVVITFHSLEDKIVKHFFTNLITDPESEIYQNLPIISNFNSKYKILTKKPILPSSDEVVDNRRSKSAKMWILERIKL